jgi:acetyl esterase/lipase
MKRFLLIIAAIAISLGTDARKDGYKYYPATDLRPDRTVFLYVPSQKEARAALKSIPDPVHAQNAETLALTPAEENGFCGQEQMVDPNGATVCISEWARFDLYFPAECNGKMIIVLPGGGYNCVCGHIEGVYAADWLKEHGYAVAVVKYRLPNGHPAIPLADVQEVMRYCRSQQQEWGVTSLGVMGFSAGGHLAATALTLYDDAATRPDFGVLFYPVIYLDGPYAHSYCTGKLLGNVNARRSENAAALENDLMRYTPTNLVTRDTPPTFIILSSDDAEVNPQNSLLFYEKLLSCGVSAELHMMRHGIHGFGFDYYKFNSDDVLFEARDNMFDCLSRWLLKR